MSYLIYKIRRLIYRSGRIHITYLCTAKFSLNSFDAHVRQGEGTYVDHPYCIIPYLMTLSCIIISKIRYICMRGICCRQSLIKYLYMLISKEVMLSSFIRYSNTNTAKYFGNKIYCKDIHAGYCAHTHIHT